MKQIIRGEGKVSITYPNDPTVRADLRGKTVTYYDVPGTSYEIKSNPRPAGTSESPIYNANSGILIMPTSGGYQGFSVGEQYVNQVVNPKAPTSPQTPSSSQPTEPIKLPAQNVSPPATSVPEGSASNLGTTPIRIPMQTKDELINEIINRPVNPAAQKIRLGSSSTSPPPMILPEGSMSNDYRNYMEQQSASGQASMLSTKSSALAEALVGKPQEYEKANPLGAAIGAGITYGITLPASIIESPIALTETYKMAAPLGFEKGSAAILDAMTNNIRQYPVTGMVTLALDVGLMAYGGYTIYKGIKGARSVSVVSQENLLYSQSYLEQRVFTGEMSKKFKGGGRGGFVVGEAGKGPVTYYDVEAYGTGKVTRVSENAVSGTSRALIGAKKTAQIEFNYKTMRYEFKEFAPAGGFDIKAGAESTFSVAKNTEAAKGYALERYTTASGGKTVSKKGGEIVREDFISTGQAAKIFEATKTTKPTGKPEILSRSTFMDIGNAQTMTGNSETAGITDLITVRKPAGNRPIPFVKAPEKLGPMKPFAIQRTESAAKALGERAAANKALETGIRTAGKDLMRSPGAGTTLGESVGIREISAASAGVMAFPGNGLPAVVLGKKRSGYAAGYGTSIEAGEYYAYPAGETPRDILNIGSGTRVNGLDMATKAGSMTGFGVARGPSLMSSSSLDMRMENLLGRDLKSTPAQSSLLKLDMGNITGQRMRQISKQKFAQSLSYRYPSEILPPLSPIEITPGRGRLPPPPLPGLFDNGGSRGEDLLNAKMLLKFGYMPSLTGIVSGKRISRRPSIVGGFEVRFPVK